MIVVLALAALPGLLWNGGPETEAALAKAGITEIGVAAAEAGAWAKSGLKVTAVDLGSVVVLDPPGVDYRLGQAGATAAPWVNSNLWNMLRQPEAVFLVEADRAVLPVAVAEAQAAGVKAYFRVRGEDLDVFAKMLTFFRSVEGPTLPGRANFAVVDDGTDEAGEVMKLLARRNLLFQAVKQRQPGYDLTIELGKAPFTSEDPYEVAGLARSKLGDARRLVRVYGSGTTLARVTGDASHTRIYLIHYGGYRVEGLRVRVRGRFGKGRVAAPGSAPAGLEERTDDADGVEFTIPVLESVAVADLWPR